MDFLVCKCGLQGLQLHIPLENLKDQDEAVSKTRDIAINTKEGITVGLFTRDATAICGWKVLLGGKLRVEPADNIQYMCGIGPGSFDFAKKQADALRKTRDNNQK